MIPKEHIEALPDSTGIYLWLDTAGKVLYVGKAKNIKKRIQGHLAHGAEYGKAEMLERAVHIDTILTSSESAAFLLENTLIKKHQPPFNVDLKDDKTYPYLMVTTEEEYPRLRFTRKVEEGKNRYFGPFYPASRARRTLKFIQKGFGLCVCNRDFSRKWPRPCFYYHLGRCLGPCVPGLTNPVEYGRAVRQALLFLEGRDKKLLAELKKRIGRKAADLRFEEAEALKGVYTHLMEMLERKQVQDTGTGDRDVFGMYHEGRHWALTVLPYRRGLLLGKREYFFEDAAVTSARELLTEVLPQYYLANPSIPPLILTPAALDEEERVLQFLKEKRGRKIKVKVPRRGDERAKLDLAVENARQAFTRRFPQGGMKELREALGLEKAAVIEAVDISHMQGKNRYGGLIRFENGRFVKKGYRAFLLHTEDPRDDFGAILEVVKRRLKRGLKEGHILPDLLLIDGGKGQVEAAHAAMKEAGADLPLAGLAKEEEVLNFPGKRKPLSLPKDNPALLLLMKVRDEVHRYVITLHRRKRAKPYRSRRGISTGSNKKSLTTA
jgi:excinuclease ABC subunit C